MRLWPSACLALTLLGCPLHGQAHGDHGPVLEELPSQRLSPAVMDTPSEWARALMDPPSGRPAVPLLREALADAPTLLYARTQGSERFDEGRLTRVRLSVEQLYRGQLSQDSIQVVEFSGARATRLPSEADHWLFLALEPMPGHSYLRDQLGAGEYYAPVRQLPAPIPVRSTQAAAALGRWLQLGRSEPSDHSRALALAMLASGESALTAVALAELRQVPVPGVLSPEEEQAIGQVMSQSLPGKGELALRLADWRLTGMESGLTIRPGDDPLTATRLRLARKRLGQSPDQQALLEQSRSGEPLERAAAGRVLGLINNDKARQRAAELALGDEDPQVRAVALYALAETGDLRVLPVLTRALDTPHQSLRFQAGRALGRFPLPARSAALDQVVRQGAFRESREYAAKLMVYHRGRDDERVQALRRSVEPGEVRRILTEGAVDHSKLHTHDNHDH